MQKKLENCSELSLSEEVALADLNSSSPSPVRQFILTHRPNQTDLSCFLIVFSYASHSSSNKYEIFSKVSLPESPFVPNMRFFKVEKKNLHLPRQKPRIP